MLCSSSVRFGDSVSRLTKQILLANECQRRDTPTQATFHSPASRLRHVSKSTAIPRSQRVNW
jgi:hypothetical protein